MVKLVAFEDGVDMSARVNEAILECLEVLIDSTPIPEQEDGDILVLIWDGVPGVDFPAVHTVDQLGLLTDEVIAVGDGVNGPVIVAVTDPQAARHDPVLKGVLDRNALNLINNLQEGVWLFGVVKTMYGLRLELKNPPELPGRKFTFSGVNPREATVRD